VTPVRRRDLAVLAVGLAVAAWLLTRTFYGEIPALRWWLPLPIGVLAVGEALGARTLHARLTALRKARSGAPGGAAARSAPVPVRPVEPLLVARVAVLAQASAYVGAVVGGVWGGILAYVGPAVGRLEDATSDSVAAVLGVLCAGGLVGAALWLESVCRVPPDDTDPPGGVRA
jgi:hypothetical protein